MASKDTLLRLLDYDRRAFETYERGVKRLGWKEAVKDREIGHHSFKDTLVHILNVHEAWLLISAQGREELWDDPRRKKSNVRSWRDLRSYRERVWKGVDDLTSTLTESDLRRVVKVPWFKGRYTLEDAIYQTSLEQAHHLGEMIGAYWQMDKAPPQMMFIPLMLGVGATTR